MEARHWGYAFYYQSRNLGDRVRLVTNPFTGQDVAVPIDPGLTKAEWESIFTLLKANGFEGPLPEGEGYCRFMPDGQRIGIQLGPTGFAVELTVFELSDSGLQMLIDIARAGNLAFTSSTGRNVRLLDRYPDQRELTRWPDAAVVHSVNDLKRWLEEEIRRRKVLIPMVIPGGQSAAAYKQSY